MHLLLIILIFSSCSVASTSAIQRYAKGEYGSAKYIGTEEEDEKSRICYFEDEEYGFVYCVASRVSDITIDGAKFGESESKSSDFGQCYCKYITEQVEEELLVLEEKYNVEIMTAQEKYGAEGRQPSDYIVEIYCLSEKEQVPSEVALAVYELYKAYDTRNFWKDNKIGVYNAEEEWLGNYEFRDNKFKTPEMIEHDYFVQQGKWKNSKAEYVRKEQKIFKELGISIYDVGHVIGTPEITEDSIVTLYFFEVDGKEFFVGDILMWDGAYYTNYDEVFEE